MNDIVLAVDGNSLMHRAYHALPLMDVNGVYTNAVHGFFMMLLKACQDVSPKYIAVMFDEHAPTFRHEVYSEYKAGRKKMDDELRMQFPIVREILNGMCLGVFSEPGWEADDLLGTISVQSAEKGIDCVILTGDKDSLQLVGGNTQVLFTKKGITDSFLFDAAGVKEQFGIFPSQVTDWKGLMGDPSDNIPGIPGIGEKTAVKLLGEYQTLEKTLESAENIKGKLGEKLKENAQMGIFSKQLATIRTDAPVTFDFDAFTADRMDEGLETLKKYSLNGVTERLKKWLGDTRKDQKAERRSESPAKDAAKVATADPAGTEFLPAAEYVRITSLSALTDFLSASRGQDTALHVNGNIITLAVPGKLAQIECGADLLTEGLSAEETWQTLQMLLQSGVCVHDGKQLMHDLRDMGVPFPVFIWDTMLGAYLMDPQAKSFRLGDLSDPDAYGVLKLYREQRTVLEERRETELMRNVEMPLMRVLYDMEKAGFTVDGGALTELGQYLTREAERLRNEVYDAAGVRDFNLNSTQQLGKVLFETLGLPAGHKTRTGYSTDAETLDKIRDMHPCVPLILQYRQVQKLNSTYIDALLNKKDKQGRIHTYFDQTGTVTGRISSSEPNLQNIPVRTPLGREVRKAFTAPKGWKLVDADYSQIELRVLAHMSGDNAMVDAFCKGQDIHTRTASEVYGVAMDEVTPAMRSSSKAVNFGLVYGISEFGLARNIGVSRYEAADFIKRYFEKYPGVKRFMSDAVKAGYERGYTETLMHRRRMLPELSASNANIRSFGERAAMNTPVQGTAADIIKLAMVRVHEALREKGLKARMILQVHDEIIIETPDEEVETVKALLRECMENVYPMKVPLVAEVKAGESWYETK